MRVEVDVSDLSELAYFIDKRCEAVEEVVKKSPAYAECRVKRQHWGGDWTFDPFVIQDKEGKDLLSLDTWEVDALSDSELLSIIDVNLRRERLEYSGSTLLFIIIMILLAPLAVIFFVWMIINPSNPNNPITMIIVFPAILVLLLYGTIYFRKRNNVISEKRHIDLVAAQENSTFLSALRKLAAITYEDEWKNEEYRNRLQYIEDTLAGINS